MSIKALGEPCELSHTKVPQSLAGGLALRGLNLGKFSP